MNKPSGPTISTGSVGALLSPQQPAVAHIIAVKGAQSIRHVSAKLDRLAQHGSQGARSSMSGAMFADLHGGR